jgi:predicted nucleic acid-binding Zn ribbon protein
MSAAPLDKPLDKLGAPATRLKRSQASLFGGIACGVGAFVLTLLLAGGITFGSVILGLVLGGALAAWVRLADL